jgi:predicted N-formylglutamate amidohydrolase
MARTSNPRLPKKPPTLLLTCEHAGNSVPPAYRALFKKSQAVLATHRGWDPGAFEVAREIQKFSQSKLIFTKLSRLVVDMNRSPESETLFSKWTRALDEEGRQKILDTHYRPYRKSIESAVASELKANRVVHVGIHSFSPYLEPSRGKCHIGILFDEKHAFETTVSKRLRETLEMVFPKLGIRMNFPYRGDGDGVTTDLRRKYFNTKGEQRYAGLEIEFNQAFLKKLKKQKSLRDFSRLFHFALENALSAQSAK